uniref:Uncharacterized protein n=1 Tax=Branchiostoma floridae TaxID=7739 RepID=C3YY22_BRAFL|eukprot:XP_002598969.1 hypothetical protein BRAFLDRAFT_79903 [Branchiostoma floridae]
MSTAGEVTRWTTASPATSTVGPAGTSVAASSNSSKEIASAATAGTFGTTCDFPAVIATTVGASPEAGTFLEMATPEAEIPKSKEMALSIALFKAVSFFFNFFLHRSLSLAGESDSDSEEAAQTLVILVLQDLAIPLQWRRGITTTLHTLPGRNNLGIRANSRQPSIGLR